MAQTQEIVHPPTANVWEARTNWVYSTDTEYIAFKGVSSPPTGSPYNAGSQNYYYKRPLTISQANYLVSIGISIPALVILSLLIP